MEQILTSFDPRSLIFPISIKSKEVLKNGGVQLGESRAMDLESVKRNLEVAEGTESASLINSLPSQIFDPCILHGLHVDLVERGRLICSMKVTPRLVVLFLAHFSLLRLLV